jgi:alpha-D-xyloside xylohydrolase
VFTAEGTVDYYLPAGRWTHFLTGQVVEGGRWLREQHGYLSLPLMVLPNSVIVVGARDDRPDYDYSAGFTLQVYQLADGGRATANLPTAAGATAVTFAVERKGQDVTVNWQGTPKDWQILLVGVEAVTSVAGGVAVSSQEGMRISPAASVTTITCTLPAAV